MKRTLITVISHLLKDDSIVLNVVFFSVEVYMYSLTLLAVMEIGHIMMGVHLLLSMAKWWLKAHNSQYKKWYV